MQVGIKWLDEHESQDFTDFFDKEVFKLGATQLPIEHDVVSPNGRHYARARCQLTVRRSEVLLDYSVFREHNNANGILLGITRFKYDWDLSPPIFDVTWTNLEEGRVYPNRIEFLTRPSRTHRLEDETKTFLEIIESARGLSDEELDICLPLEGFSPPKRTVTTEIYLRNPYVVEYTFRQANGRCQKCGSAGPFLARSSGKPYLEVHHLVPLSQGGADDTDNAIALCPNCHREAHYGDGEFLVQD